MSIYKQMGLHDLSLLVVGLVVSLALLGASAERETEEQSDLSTGETDYDDLVESVYGEPTRPRSSSEASSSSQFFQDGDPDANIWSKNKRVARIRSGNVGYARLVPPNWFRPLRNRAQNDGVVLRGSFIVIGKRHMMIDKSFRDDHWPLKDPPKVGEVREVVPRGSNDYDIADRYSPTKEVAPRHPYDKDIVKVKAHMRNGFLLYELLNGTDYLFTYKWDINMGGDARHREPYVDCFLLKYTTLHISRLRAKDTITEVPIKVVQNRTDKSYCGLEMPEGYSPFNKLEGWYNEGSPVFCGIQGKLRFFARQLGKRNELNCTLELLPIDVVAEELKEHVPEVYHELCVEKRHEPKTETPFQPPPFYRGLYKAKGVQEKDPSKGNYGGPMIMLDEFYFIVHDEVAKQTLDAQYKSGWEWEKRSSSDQALRLISDFKLRKEKTDDSWPTFVGKLGKTNMSLYKRAKADTAWTAAYFKVDFHHDPDTYTYCELIVSNPSQNKSDAEELVETSAVPVHIVPHSCSRWFCYFIHDDKGDPKMSWRKYAPIMCGSKPEFIAMDTEGRPPGAGKLAMSMNYILELIRKSHYDVYKNLVVNPRSFSDPSQIPDLAGCRPPPIPATRWFKPLLNNAPVNATINDPYLGFAGIAIAISGQKFVVADHVANNAFFPTESEYFYFDKLLVTPFHENHWMNDSRNPKEGGDYNIMTKELYPYTARKRWSLLKTQYPRHEFFFANHSFRLMSNELGFVTGQGIPPRFRDLINPDEELKALQLRNETCYALTYLPGHGKLLLGQIALLFDRCDTTHCYFHTNHDLYNINSDLSKGVHAGVPIFCGYHVIGFNEPYPDQLNRAIFRVLHQSIMLKHAYSQGNYGDYLTDWPPHWYRNVFSDQLLNSTDEDYYLKPMIVLSPKYYLCEETQINRYALEHSGFNWALFQSEDEPTPPRTVDLYDRRYKHPDDNIIPATFDDPFFVGTLMREPGFEPLNRTVEKLYKEDVTPMKDCYAYFYRYEGIGNEHHIFRFVKTKVKVDSYGPGVVGEIKTFLHHTVPAPVVCGGILSYVIAGRHFGYEPNSHTIVKVGFYIEQLGKQRKEEEPIPNIKYVDLMDT